MSKNTYWITTAEGTHAQVEGVEERDKYTPLGWTETGEPKATDFVWMAHPDIEKPARFAYEAAATWQRMGWELCGPPPVVDVTKDPQFFDQQATARQEPKKAASTNSASGKSATATENTEGVNRG